MLPILLTAGSLAFLAALCCGYPGPVAGTSAKNGFLRITMPATLAYYGGQAAVRIAAYAHERAELVLKHAGALLGGNIAAWTTWSFLGGIIGPASMFVAFYALIWGLQRSRPAIRWREYVGHAVEVREVERHGIVDLADYRTWEIDWMRAGYDGLFATGDIKDNLRRADRSAAIMLWLIGIAVSRFRAMPV